ncbi:MAG TPA: lactate dehydrogenase [Lactobacillus sp.]|nr:lactate dehydrogenase [Lactobacillus sp.]
MKIVCYGVRSNETAYFEKLNKYNFDLKLVPEFLTHENVNEAEGMDAVLVRGNCVCDRQNLQKFHDFGIKYMFTRSVGVNHIDLVAAKDLDLLVARVPNYSPFAVAELALSLGMNLYRHLNVDIVRTTSGNFKVLPDVFSGEIHNATVGIVGTGRIGATEAKLYKGLGAKVLGYDPYPSEYAKQYVEFTDLDNLLSQSDIVSVHVPYFPGQNDNLINADFLSKMKASGILINTARGELADTKAIISAIKNDDIQSYGADVTMDESNIMGHEFSSLSDVPNQDVRELVGLYPKVLITPHVGSFTEPALEDMISISFDNFHETVETGTNKNIVTK